VLLGKVNPSGKLPVNLPGAAGGQPAYINGSYPGCREVELTAKAFLLDTAITIRGMCSAVPIRVWAVVHHFRLQRFESGEEG